MIEHKPLKLTDTELRRAILSTHFDVEVEGFDSRGTSFNLAYLIRSVPMFSPYLLYEGAGYQTTQQYVTTNLNRLIKAKHINAFPILKSKEGFKKLYYITKSGFNRVSEEIPTNVSYKSKPGYASKAGKRMQNTCIHDYSLGFAYLAFLLSPYSFNVNYDYSLMQDAIVMAGNKKMASSLRPDAMFTIHDDYENVCYIEQDTGYEDYKILADKLLTYNQFGVMSKMYIEDTIIMSIRKTNPLRPSCFSPAKLDDIISLMSPDMTLSTLFADKSLSEDRRSVIDGLYKFFPRKAPSFTQNDLISLSDGLKTNISVPLYAYYESEQYAFTIRRREKVLEYLLAFTEGKSLNPYLGVINSMCAGFRVFFTPTISLPKDLSSLLFRDKDILYGGYEILYGYFGELHYRSPLFEVPSSSDRRLCLRNHYINNDKTASICLEYISRDLSATIRLKRLLSGKDYDTSSFRIVLLVDNKKDALFFSDLLKIPDQNKDDPFISFVDIGSDDLYIIKDGKYKALPKKF